MTSSSDGRVTRQISNLILGPESTPPVHSTTSKKTSDAVQSPEQSKPTEPANHQDVRDQNSNSNAGFRHSSQERKNILRGSVRVNGANNQKDIQGASNSNHRIKAAVQNSVVSNILVYVGKLAPNTTCDDVRCHLNDVNIDNVSDVMILNGIGRSQECYFCVSLDNEESMKKMFNPIIWPSGTVVRPFRPARAKRTREKRGPQKESYNRHHSGPVDSHRGSLTPTAMITTVGGGTTTSTATIQKIHTRTGWLIDGTEVTMSMSIIETNYLCFTLIHYVS